MFLTYSENSTFYFFSTGAQSIASIVGLSAAIAVFRYQYYLQDISGKRQHILDLLKDAQYLQMFGQSDSLAYNKFTSNYERVEWWRKHLKQAYNGVVTPELEKWLKRKIAAQSWAGRPETAKEEELKRLVLYFKDNYLEYDALDLISSRAIKFKEQVLTLTQWGLILVGFGILGTLLPGVAVCNVGGQLGIKVLFVIGVCVYFYKLFRLISQAFESN